MRYDGQPSWSEETVITGPVFEVKDGKSLRVCQCLRYLPRSKQGRIIFTTRDRKTAIKLEHQNIVELSQMSEDTATKLLHKYLVPQDLVNNKQDTKRLLAQLTYFPLAIVQAAANINENVITLADYLLLLEGHKEEVIDLLSGEFGNDLEQIPDLLNTNDAWIERPIYSILRAPVII